MTKYKIPVILAITLLLINTIGTAQKYTGDSWNKVKSQGNGTLSVVYYTSEGMIQKGNDGRMTGVCVELLEQFTQYVKNQYNVSLSINYMAEEKVFSTFLSNVASSSNVLGVSNITVTPDRAKIMNFTPAFMQNPVVLLAHKNAPDIHDLSELSSKYNGYTAKVIEGSSHTQYMNAIKHEHFPAMKIQYEPSEQHIMDQVSNDDRLFTIMDFTEYIEVVKKRLPLKRLSVDMSTYKEDIGFIMPKSSDWYPLWQEFLTPEYKNSLAFKKSIADNLGKPFLALVN